MYNVPVMAINFFDILNQSRQQLGSKVAERDAIDKEISELRMGIRALAKLVPDQKMRDEILAEVKQARRPTPSMTDAIAAILQNAAPSRLTSTQIRDQLEETGFDLEEYSQPLATIMATAQRLAESGKVVRLFNPPRRGKRQIFLGYRWKGEDE
jgi:hypothetical protein